MTVQVVLTPIAWNHSHKLKQHNHAKIFKKTVILFRLLNMTILCKSVHRLVLHFILIFVLRIYQLGEI